MYSPLAFGLSLSNAIRISKTLLPSPHGLLNHSPSYSLRRFRRPSRPYCSYSNLASSSSVSPPVVQPSSNMKFNRLGSSDLLVTEVCLGTMTWGVQNTEEDAHAQLDYALSRGINFIDTAELYPVPTSAPKQRPGTTEEYIGTYFQNNPDVRSKVILATKVVGYNKKSKTAAHRYSPPKDPAPDSRHDKESILTACDASLKRLQTDYIDLYQLHWPDRYAANFGSREYKLEMERDSIPIRDILLALKQLLDAGKIRAYGLSNETTFGVCEFVRLADEIGMPRPATIQNPFCLLNRAFEFELAEACSPRNFNIGLLPWSILAGGALTGKYNGKNLGGDGNDPDETVRNARFVLFPSFQGRFLSKQALAATEKYMKIAKKHDMSCATLAQAFCKSRWYIPSSIIGATTVEHLKENIDAFEIDLSEEILNEIDAVHNENKDCVLSV